MLEQTRDEVLDLLRKSVRPEFINRIDEIIMFRPLNRADIRKIVDIQVDLIVKRLGESGVNLDISEAARDRSGEAWFRSAIRCTSIETRAPARNPE